MHSSLPACFLPHQILLTIPCNVPTTGERITYGVFPERKHRVFPSIVDTYGPNLEKRYGEGCRNIVLLWQEIKAQGFEGQSSTVRTWLRHRFGSPKEGMMNPLVKKSTSIGHQRIAWLMLKADPLKNGYLKALYRAAIWRTRSACTCCRESTGKESAKKEGAKNAHSWAQKYLRSSSFVLRQTELHANRSLYVSNSRFTIATMAQFMYLTVVETVSAIRWRS